MISTKISMDRSKTVLIEGGQSHLPLPLPVVFQRPLHAES